MCNLDVTFDRSSLYRAVVRRSILGDSDWVEVSRKKRRSVFDRLNYSHVKSSNADDLAKISLSVYVSNFPSHLTKRELWNICSKLGTLADVFSADQKNKLGQMYAFCRYIKVENIKNLIDALCKIRIGKLRLNANVARFSRNEVGSYSQKSVRNAKLNITGVDNNDSKTPSQAK
ncbi:reverse transcriptase domain, reverse transcriptase zinc-binding domain protein [Tanacetum coccineum]